jgi:hypothetical protein
MTVSYLSGPLVSTLVVTLVASIAIAFFAAQVPNSPSAADFPATAETFFP